MNYSKYDLNASDSYDSYEFISEGLKGKILKGVMFIQSKGDQRVYDLIMGDIDENGGIDCESETNNGDMKKVLATVVVACYKFLLQYPDCKIAITGSNNVRTRLYRMAINVNNDELSADFHISGIVWNPDIDDGYIVEEFQKGCKKWYDAFLVKWK